MSEAELHLRELFARTVAPRPGTIARLELPVVSQEVRLAPATRPVYWCVPNPFIGSRLLFAWDERRFQHLMGQIRNAEIRRSAAVPGTFVGSAEHYVEALFNEALRPSVYPQLFASLEREWRGELQRRYDANESLKGSAL